jgi:hypothetical protein
MYKYALRFTNDTILDALKKSAQNNHRSLNGEIMRAIEFYLKNAPDAQYEIKEATKKKSSKAP